MSTSPRDVSAAALDAEKESPEETQPFQLKPLVEMEVIGACRRGRRRGRRNRTAAERQSDIVKEQRRRLKNARERKRVENVKNEYVKLMKILGLQSDMLDEKCKEKRRYCKLKTLNTALRRIKELMALVSVPQANSRLEDNDATPPPNLQQSIPHSNYAVSF